MSRLCLRLFYAVALFLFISKVVSSAPSCSLVIKDIAPCLGYLQGQDATPQCCQGVKSLVGMAKTKEDRTGICNCVKKALASYEYNPGRIPPLPKECGANVELPPVDKDYDCSKA